MLGLTTLRLGGHYLAMITISFQQIFDLVLVNWIDVTHGPDGIPGIMPPSLFGLALDRQPRLSAAVRAGAVCLMIVFVWWLPHDAARAARCVRCARTSSRPKTIGVHTLRIKVIAFTLSATLGGIGGGLYAAGFAYISPDNFNFARSIEFLTDGAARRRAIAVRRGARHRAADRSAARSGCAS